MLNWFRKHGREGSPEPEVILYTRQRCHLCDEAKALLLKLQREEPFRLVELDIDADAELRERFNEEVPVIFIHGRKAFKYAIDPGKFLKSLRAGPSAAVPE